MPLGVYALVRQGRYQERDFLNTKYSGTSLIRSKKNLALLTRIFFFQENVRRFLPGGQRKWP